MKILILASNPKDTSRLRLDEEIREIGAGLARSKRTVPFELHHCLATRPRDVRRAILDHAPNIVHFSGHGAGDEGLVLEDDLGISKYVSASALSGLFDLVRDDVECVILNACYSEFQAKAIACHIPYVIGMNRSIGDKAAIEFSVGFYDAVAAGKSIEDAYKFGCNAIIMSGINEHTTPVLLKRSDVLLQHTNDIEHQTVENRMLFGPNRSAINSRFDPLHNAIDCVTRFISYENYYVRQIQSSEELEELWHIDRTAYRESSISLPRFHEWWSVYECGVKALFYMDRIVGAIGIWPLCEAMASRFISGGIGEDDLIPMAFARVRKQCSRNWYISGIVIQQEYRKLIRANPVALLLRVGINTWIESRHIEYPVEILSFALTHEGENMLRRFCFIEKMRDEKSAHRFYKLRANSKFDLVRVFNRRGI